MDITNKENIFRQSNESITLAKHRNSKLLGEKRESMTEEISFESEKINIEGWDKKFCKLSPKIMPFEDVDSDWPRDSYSIIREATQIEEEGSVSEALSFGLLVSC